MADGLPGLHPDRPAADQRRGQADQVEGKADGLPQAGIYVIELMPDKGEKQSFKVAAN